MAAATYDLYIEQGSTFRFTMIYGRRDGTVDVNGNPNVIPYDITGCKARMQIRTKRGGAVLVAATTNNGGIVFTDPIAGKIVVTITDEATDNLGVTRALYDLELSYPSGDVFRILEGKVKISPNITQGAEPHMLENHGSHHGGSGGDMHTIDEQDVDKNTHALDQSSTAF